MKYLKIFGLTALAAAAVTAIGSGAASATVLTCSTGVHCNAGTTIHAEAEGKTIFHPIFGDIECNSSTLEASTTNTGGAGIRVVANVGAASYTGCNATVSVINKGTLAIEGIGGNNGTLISTNLTLTTEFLGVHCLWATGETDIGTVTGSATTGGSATFDISGAFLKHGGRSGAFCGKTMPWTGSYKLSSPATLNVD